MKKITALALIIISAIFAANGQQYSLGFKPSFLIVNAKYTEEPEVFGLSPSARGSYAFGVTLGDQINRLIGLKTELRIIAKGYNINWGQDPDDKDIYRNNYLSLPILITISPIQNLNLEFGPDIGYLINSKVKYSGNTSFHKNNSPNLKPFEFSLLIGVNYSFSKRFDFGGRYGFGLTACEEGPMLISDWTGPDVNYKYVQNYIEFYLNTRFMIKTKNN
jgi:hypothetical protein